MSVLPALPRKRRSLDPANQCAALLAWFHDPDNHAATRSLVSDIERHNRSNIVLLFPSTLEASPRQ